MIDPLALGGNPNTDPLPGWPVYVAAVPDTPDEVMTVTDTAPTNDARSMIDGTRFVHYGFQVRIRSTTPAKAALKAFAVRRAFDESVHNRLVTIDGVEYVVGSISNATVLAVGKESPTSKRSLFTINALVSLRAIAAA
jgi:hypothetical protein